MSFLENYLEKAASLPIDVNRCLRLIRELDERFQGANLRLEDLQHDYMSRLKNAKDKKQEMQKPECQAILEEIRQLQDECAGYCRAKFEISAQSYDVVVEKMEKLEEELKKHEEENKLQQQQVKPVPPVNKKKTIDTSFAIPSDPLEIKDTAMDQNEPRYCICNGVSYGDMIQCDFEYCEKEWFHFACIGLKSLPPGKWYCPECKNKKYFSMMKTKK